MWVVLQSACDRIACRTFKEMEIFHSIWWCLLFYFWPVLLHRDRNCTAIWEAFKVVLDKDPCSVLPSDYDLFINLSRHSIPRDKVITAISDKSLPSFFIWQRVHRQGVGSAAPSSLQSWRNTRWYTGIWHGTILAGAEAVLFLAEILGLLATCGPKVLSWVSKSVQKSPQRLRDLARTLTPGSTSGQFWMTSILTGPGAQALMIHKTLGVVLSGDIASASGPRYCVYSVLVSLRKPQVSSLSGLSGLINKNKWGDLRKMLA